MCTFLVQDEKIDARKELSSKGLADLLLKYAMSQEALESLIGALVKSDQQYVSQIVRILKPSVGAVNLGLFVYEHLLKDENSSSRYKCFVRTKFETYVASCHLQGVYEEIIDPKTKTDVNSWWSIMCAWGQSLSLIHISEPTRPY